MDTREVYAKHNGERANSMEIIVANLAGKIRRVIRGDREYLVAPMILIVPGVLNGSKGPLLYPPEECAKDPTSWNGIPIVVNHPVRNGVPISARHPDILDKQWIGFVFNTLMDSKLSSEGWFDVQATKRVDARVLNTLEEGRPLELSTGLFTDNEPAPNGAVFNTPSGPRPYTFIAKNYKPDHLAVLPDNVGACSINDGCGVLVNMTHPQSVDIAQRNVWQRVGEMFGIIPNNVAPSAASLTSPIINDYRMVSTTVGDSPTINKPSFNDISSQLNNLIIQRFGSGSKATSGPISYDDAIYILDVYDDYVIYKNKDKYYSIDYSVDSGTGVVTLSKDQPTEVVRVTDYVPVDNSAANMGIPSDRLTVTPEKACKILKDRSVRGKPLTDRQRGLFGVICGRRGKKKKGATANASCGCNNGHTANTADDVDDEAINNYLNTVERFLTSKGIDVNELPTFQVDNARGDQPRDDHGRFAEGGGGGGGGGHSNQDKRDYEHASSRASELGKAAHELSASKTDTANHHIRAHGAHTAAAIYHDQAAALSKKVHGSSTAESDKHESAAKEHRDHADKHIRKAVEKGAKVSKTGTVTGTSVEGHIERINVPRKLAKSLMSNEASDMVVTDDDDKSDLIQQVFNIMGSEDDYMNTQRYDFSSAMPWTDDLRTLSTEARKHAEYNFAVNAADNAGVEAFTLSMQARDLPSHMEAINKHYRAAGMTMIAAEQSRKMINNGEQLAACHLGDARDHVLRAEHHVNEAKKLGAQINTVSNIIVGNSANGQRFEAPFIFTDSLRAAVTNTSGSNNMALTKEQRQQIVRDLAANCQDRDVPWRGKDVNALSQLTDNELAAFDSCRRIITGAAASGPAGGNVATSPAAPPVGNTVINPTAPVPVASPVQRPRNMIEALEMFGSQEDKSAWNSVAMVLQREKASIIERIVGNMEGERREQYTQWLQSKDIDELRRMAILVPQEQSYQQQQQQAPAFNFLGAAAAPLNPMTNEEPLASPVYNFGTGNS